MHNNKAIDLQGLFYPLYINTLKKDSEFFNPKSRDWNNKKNELIRELPRLLRTNEYVPHKTL